MSVDINYDGNRKVLCITVSGISDPDELTAVLDTITNSDDYPPDTNAIWDIRKADIANANYQLICELVKIRSRFKKRNNCRAALIVSSNVQYGLSRMFEILSDGKIKHQFKVFRNYDEGEKWLLKNKTHVPKLFDPVPLK